MVLNKEIALNFALEYAIRRAEANQDGLKLNGCWFMLMMLIYWVEV
jgi:hypothetical protein